MKPASVTKTDPFIYKMGNITPNRFWIQRPDGQMLQLDEDAINVLERLANHERVPAIAIDLNVEEAEIVHLLDKLGLDGSATFSLVREGASENDLSALESRDDGTQKQKTRFFLPWLEQRWFVGAVVLILLVAVASVGLFVYRTPLLFVRGLKEQWLLAGALTLSVVVHEIGHLLTMPRHRNISISIHWSGPIPLLSIICNEAWKLSKWRRMRMNIAGFAADVIVCGLAGAVGLLAEALSPWIWTFLFVQLLRMFFSIWPLLPGDGYWMLVDALEQPNLWAKATDQLKQRKMTWASLYALTRMLFLGFIWILYGYVIFMWSSLLLGQPVKNILLFLLHPAPLLISLNLLHQVYRLVSGVIHWMRSTDRMTTVRE